MATLNARTCITSQGNTGIQPCFLDPKFMAGGWLTPKGDELDISGNVQTALAAKIYNTNKAARWYPFYFLEALTVNTEKKTIQTMAQGNKHVVREGYNDWQFQYQAGGLSLHRNYRLFNGSNYDFVFFDNDAPNWNLMGIVGSAATKLKSIPSDGGFFWADPWNPNDGSKIAEYMLQFVYASKYLNDFIATVSGNFDIPSTLPGLIDVVLSSPGAGGSSGHYKISVVSPLGVDIGAKYSSALAAAGAWAPKNPTTGGAITVTSVAWVASADGIAPGYFDLLLDTTDTDYPAAGSISHNLVNPATLSATPYGVAIEATAPLSIARN